MISEDNDVGMIGIDPAYTTGAVYLRTDAFGVSHLYTLLNGEEREVLTVPAIPADPPDPEPEPASGATLWEHLTETD